MQICENVVSIELVLLSLSGKRSKLSALSWCCFLLWETLKIVSIELVLLSDPKLAVSALSNSLPRDADATDRMCIEAQLVFDRFEAPCPFLDYHVQTARYDRCGPYRLVARSSDFQCTATHPDPARARRYDQQNKAAWRARRGGASA